MWKFVATAKQILWELVELGFLAVLVLILLHLLLGAGSGTYVASVADNVAKFASGASAGLLGAVLVLAIVFFVLKRANWSAPTRK